jgi:2-C-methyl-D-erythritol 4-phosphate cytidylyltransferase
VRGSGDETPGRGPITVGVAVPAAGSGRRMGGTRKPFLELAGEPVLLHAIRPFLQLPEVVAVAVALSEEDAAPPPGWLIGEDDRVRVVVGGATRRDSVWNAMAVLPQDVSLIAVHDAARPLIPVDVVQRCIAEAAKGHGAVAGIPATDTMKEVDRERLVVSTPDRSRLWHAQTPQVFPRPLLVAAYRRAVEEGWPATDDSAVVERAGGAVVMVQASPANMKVTQPGDLELAELRLREGA